jgi:hypothetical protein
MKRRATHNQYFPDFPDLVAAVDDALAYFAGQVAEIKSLVGLDIATQGEPATAV